MTAALTANHHHIIHSIKHFININVLINDCFVIQPMHCETLKKRSERFSREEAKLITQNVNLWAVLVTPEHSLQTYLN